MLKPYYIYRHVRRDSNSVFYIGKGKNRREQYSYERAHSTASRNIFWSRIVSKCAGYDVEIVMEFSTPEECVAKEKELIALYGRADMNCGTLCNLTDGGDGSWGLVISESLRQKRREVRGERHANWGKKLSAETCNKKSVALLGEKHHLHGKRLPTSWRENIRKAKIGSRNPMFGKSGKLHPASIPIRNTETGAIFYGVSSAAKAVGITASILYQYLDGTRPNKTTLVREVTHA